MNRWVRRGVVAWAFLSVGFVFGVPPALADSAAPTNYESVVTSVAPRTQGVRFEVVGGDAYMTVTVDPPHTVQVPGYFNEPYIRIDADGMVFVNVGSAAHQINEDRYGQLTQEEIDRPQTAPDWELVATDGRYAWHDHRTHWMSLDRPPTVGGGERELVFPWELPVIVDGSPATVSGELYWSPSRSVVPALMAGIVALLPLVFLSGRDLRLLGGMSVVAGAVSTVATIAMANGTPAIARSLPMSAALGIGAIACGAGVLFAHRRPAVSMSLAAAGGAFLIVSALPLLSVLWLPVVPADAPSLMRAAVAYTLWSGIAVLGATGFFAARGHVREVPSTS